MKNKRAVEDLFPCRFFLPFDFPQIKYDKNRRFSQTFQAHF